MLTLSRTLCQFVSFWLTAAGLYFLVARMSDGENKIVFFECLYFLIVSKKEEILRLLTWFIFKMSNFYLFLQKIQYSVIDPQTSKKKLLAQVTISTIGYGDIKPETNSSRIVIIVLIAVGLVSNRWLDARAVPRAYADPADLSISPSGYHNYNRLWRCASCDHE